MKKSIIFLSLAMGLAAVAMAQPEPIQTTKDYGLYGPVKKVTRVRQFYVFPADELISRIISLEFDEQGRRSDGYAYDSKGRMVLGDGTYYSYDPSGRLSSEQNGDDYLVYNYDKNGRLTSCESYQLGSQGRKDLWVKSYKYDKQGRLLGAEAKTTDKKSPKFVFSYQVIYAPDGTPKGYAYTYMGDPEYDDYGELVDSAHIVTDTLPYDDWATYAVNHATGYDRPSDSRDYREFDDHGNGIAWWNRRIVSTDPVYDEYGEVIEDGHDTILWEPENRTIEYYGQYGYTISLTGMDVLYREVENPVKVVVNGVPDNLVLWENEEDTTYEFSTDENGQRYITPYECGSILRVPVNIVENDKVKNIGYRQFRVRDLPTPTLYIGNYPSGSTIPREELAKMKNISFRYPDWLLFQVGLLRVRSQAITIAKVKGAENLQNEGADWSPEIIANFAKIKKSCELTIDANVILHDKWAHIVGTWTVE